MIRPRTTTASPDPRPHQTGPGPHAGPRDPGFGAWATGSDRIVAERNNGDAIVEATIRMVDSNVPVTTVWASRGKVARAEPVSALYGTGAV